MADVITISNLPTDMGNVTRDFVVKYVVTDTDNTSSFTVTQQIDNTVIQTSTVNQGAVVPVTVSIENLNEGNHTLIITASTSSASATANVSFFVDKDQYGFVNKSLRLVQAKVNVLNYNFQIVDEISGNVTSGSITEDANSDIRRTCNITMVVTNGQFNIQPGGEIWLDKFIQIYIGVDNLYTGNTQWFNKGIYIIDQPSYSFDPATSTLTFQGLDLMAKMTGQRNGYLEGIPTLIPQGSNIRDVMISTITQLGGFSKYAIEDNPQPVPYDIQIDPGGTVYDILVALRDILPSWQIYFDENGVFRYEPIPNGVNEPIMVYDDVWDEVVLSETISTDFSNVKNVVEVWGRTLEPAYYGEATVSGNTYKVTISEVSSYTDSIMYGFTAPSVITNPQFQVNSLSALPVVMSDGSAAVIPEADTYYVVMYQEESNNFLFMGYLQPYAIAQDTNPQSPFYVNGPVGPIRIVLQGGDYDNIYTTELAQERADYELWRRTRLEDSVTLTAVPLYYLTTNIVVSKTLTNETDPTLFITKSITTDLAYSGSQTIQMITYYPLYPSI